MHPDQSLAYQYDLVNHGDLYDLLTAAVGRGNAPEVVMVDYVWVAGLAQAGFLYALEDLGPQWSQRTSRSEFYDVFLVANSFDGKLYGLPVKADASLLWYRKDWFADEGLLPPSNWDELRQVSDRFRQPTVKARYGLDVPLAFPGGTAAGEATVYNLMPLVWSAGGQIFEGETVAIDTPPTREALAFLRELVSSYDAGSPSVIELGVDDTPHLFAQGRAAMALGGSYEEDLIRGVGGWDEAGFRKVVGCAPPPAAPGRGPVSAVGGISYVILRQGRRPEQVLDLLESAIDPKIVGQLYRTLGQGTSCPSLNAILGPDEEPVLAQATDLMSSGRSRPSIPEYVKVSRQLQLMFQRAISEEQPIEEITARTAEFIAVVSERPVRVV
jgi:ABC-type glycerol-3-phosphate transport system substrate-binding protein